MDFDTGVGVGISDYLYQRGSIIRPVSSGQAVLQGLSPEIGGVDGREC